MFIRHLALYFTLVGFVFFVPLSYAQEEKQIVRVGYTPDGGIITNINSVDKKGYGYEVLERVEHSSNLLFEFIPYKNEDVLDALLADEIDIMGPVPFIDAFAHYVSYIPTNIGEIQSLLASNSEKPVYYNDLEAIDGSTIVVSLENPFLTDLRSFLQKNNIGVRYIYRDYSGLSHVDADYYLATNIDATFNDYQNALNLSRQKVYFVGNKKNKAINEEINRALAEIAAHDNSFFIRTFGQYFANTKLSRRYLTKEESSLLKGKKFRVAYTTDHQPIEFLNKEGQPDGIAVEILNLLAKEHGFEVEYHGYNLDSPIDEKENFDLIISIQDSYEELHDYYTMSADYLRLPTVIMARLEEGELFEPKDAFRIGTYDYTTLDYDAIREKYPNGTFLRFNNITEAVRRYFMGEFDVAIFTATGAEYISSVVGLSGLTTYSTGIDLPLKIFVNKKLPSELVTAFNIAIMHMDKSVIDEIVTRQTRLFIPNNTILRMFKDNFVKLIVLFMFIIVIVALLISRAQRAKRKEIQSIIDCDMVTDLISIYSFRKSMRHILNTARKNEYQIITLDVDYFRIINSIFGFDTGTRTIHAIADNLQEKYANSDALVSRVVGDLFVIFAKNNLEKDIQHICRTAIMPAISEIVGSNYALSISIGAYTIKNCSEDVNIIMDRANMARLRGKQFHALTYFSFDDEMQNSFRKQTDIVTHMEQALRDKEFKVFYQPKIDYSTMQIVGAEALIRWFPKNGDSYSPSDFIPVFEANGFISQLDYYVFEQVFEFINANSANTNIPCISINLSGITLDNSTTPLKLESLLSRYKISPRRIEVEVTESAFLDNDVLMSSRVDDIKKLGFTISIDDFGAGVSSLNRLASMNVDVLKLDKAFLESNSQLRKGTIIIENIIRMAKSLELKVVSEGVENLAQASWLKDIGCDLAQGYYFERPMPEEDFVELLKMSKTYEITLR